jgi:hypothetical protein
MLLKIIDHILATIAINLEGNPSFFGQLKSSEIEKSHVCFCIG